MAADLGCERLVAQSALLGQPVITVAIQYRLGWLGFLTSTDFELELEHSDDGLGAGNWGLIDQRNAFFWVQKHIAGFGGDPNNVTAFGNPFIILIQVRAQGQFQLHII